MAMKKCSVVLIALLCAIALVGVGCGEKDKPGAKAGKPSGAPPLSSAAGNSAGAPSGEIKQGKQLSALGGGGGAPSGGAPSGMKPNDQAPAGPVSGKVFVGGPTGGWNEAGDGSITRDGETTNLLITAGGTEYRLTFPAGGFEKKGADGAWQAQTTTELFQRNNGAIIVIKTSDIRLRLDLNLPYPPAAAALTGLKQRNT